MAEIRFGIEASNACEQRQEDHISSKGFLWQFNENAISCAGTFPHEWKNNRLPES